MDERKIKMLCETMFDLTWNLCDIIHDREMEEEIACYDSRSLFQSVYSWAKEFEDNYVDDNGDYLEDVDAFFWAKIEEEFPELV